METPESVASQSEMQVAQLISEVRAHLGRPKPLTRGV